MKYMKRERRAYPRAGIKWPVLVKTNKGSTKGITLNVTPNGVFIRCQKPLRLNEIVEIVLHIPNSKRVMAAKTEVVWSNIYGPDDEITPRGMGVRFIKIGTEDRRFIAQASLKHLKAAKIDPELLDTLNTLIIDLFENDPDIKHAQRSDEVKTTPAV
jgi:uncharacterized protein (TIGR02266 family)